MTVLGTPPSPVASLELHGLLDQDASASTWEARQVEGGHAVHLVLPAYPRDRRDLRDRFRRDARTLTGLRDPHLVTCLDAGLTAAGEPYLVTEVPGGLSLPRLIATDGHFAWRDAVQLVRDLAASLQKVHDLGLVHRGITPDRVRLLPRPADGIGAFRPLLLGLGTIAPEVAPEAVPGGAPELGHSAESVDFRADHWGLGAILALAASPHAPPAVHALAAHLRHPDRDRRPASDGEVIAACDRLLGRLRLGHRGNRAAWFGVAAAVIGCGVAATLAGISLTDRQEPPPAPLAAAEAAATPPPAPPTPATPVDDRLGTLTWDEPERLWDPEEGKRLEHWDLQPAAQWTAAAERPDAVAGFRGWIHRDVGPAPWRIDAHLHLVTTDDTATEALYLGVLLEDGGRIAVQVRTQGAAAIGQLVRLDAGSTPLPAGAACRRPTGVDLPVTLLVGAHALVATLDGHEFGHVVLSAAPVGVALGLDGERPGEISQLTLRHPTP